MAEELCLWVWKQRAKRKCSCVYKALKPTLNYLLPPAKFYLVRTLPHFQTRWWPTHELMEDFSHLDHSTGEWGNGFLQRPLSRIWKLASGIHSWFFQTCPNNLKAVGPQWCCTCMRYLIKILMVVKYLLNITN